MGQGHQQCLPTQGTETPGNWQANSVEQQQMTLPSNYHKVGCSLGFAVLNSTLQQVSAQCHFSVDLLRSGHNDMYPSYHSQMGHHTCVNSLMLENPLEYKIPKYSLWVYSELYINAFKVSGYTQITKCTALSSK